MSTQEAYHNHKEQMVYVLGALYLAAASWIINSPHPEWVRGLFFEVFFIVVVVVVALYGY
jgi:glucan phosphoethanolaminetransferase (alkaline phosphatase superfamily)